jgi:hypothetical protein
MQVASQQQDGKGPVIQSPYPQEVKHCIRVYRQRDLVQGFKGKACSFEFTPMDQCSPTGRARFEKLRDDLRRYGMKHPLITYQGHILIGMRRFEVVQEWEEEFTCVEVLEQVENWVTADIVRLNNFNATICGDDLNRF